MHFTAEFFTHNRQRLLEVTNAELVVITAHGLLQRSADTTFAFRQESNFWYLSGVNEPDFVIVITPEESFLIAPRRPEHRDMWDGALRLDDIQKQSGVTAVYEHIEGWNKLDRLIKKNKKVHTITPAEPYFESFGFYANPARGALLTALKKHRQVELVDVRRPLARVRQVKRPAEIEALRQAINITSETLQKVKTSLKKYKNERELVADITAAFIRKGAMGHAYSPIVASGKNAATIHYIDCDAPIDQSGLLLFDVGAEVMNYSADISRTYALAPPTARQAQLHGVVHRVQKAAFDLLRPGVMMRAYEQQVDEIMAKELLSIGLINDEHDKKKLKKYYPHLTSHFLGLDTHDAADYEMPLEPGMVLTVEPGVYIPEEGIGIRIEDDVLLTETGIEVLSASLPSTLE